MHTSERLYYSDSFLKTFTAVVTEAREFQGRHENSVWRVSLNRTAFYPTSGGQPFDTGVLRTTSPGRMGLEIPVEEVEEDEEGTVWHFVREPLSAGSHVEGWIDWERRFDHMQQHTGQHLLSAVFLKELHATTVSFHLGGSTSTIDLATASLAQASLERVERIANEIIAEDRSLVARFVSRDEADSMLASGELRKLPDRRGAIRLIEIPAWDCNACGGTHVRSTGQIGGLLVRGVEKVSRGLRVEFVCGLRAIRAARADTAILKETAVMLSVGTQELPASVNRLLLDGKTRAKERHRLREELADFQGFRLAAEVPVQNGLRLVVREWKDRDRDYVKLLALRTAAALPSTAVVFTAKETDPTRVFIARSQDLNFDCGKILREAQLQQGLRGGGSPDLAQGDVPVKQEPLLRGSLIEAIRNAASLTHQIISA